MHNILAVLQIYAIVAGSNRRLKEKNTRYIDYIQHDEVPLIIYDVSLG
jgi:hypothetical protein